MEVFPNYTWFPGSSKGKCECMYVCMDRWMHGCMCFALLGELGTLDLTWD